MAPDRPPQPEGEHPGADDPLAALRKLAGLAKELGVSDVGTFTEMLETARNEGRGGELLKPIKSLVDQFAGQKDTTRSRSDLGARLMSLVSGSGAGTVAELQDKAKLVLLRRIEELGSTASIEGVLDLATAYARLNTAPASAGGDVSGARQAE
jgi:hypothetical protein